MTHTNLFLQAPASGSGAMMQILMIALLVIVFYFFIIRPQTKKQKELQKAREALKSGDKVITSGGMYGIIKDINRTTGVVVLEVWEGVKVKVDFNTIYAVSDTTEKGNSK